MCWVGLKRLDRAIVMVDVNDDAKEGYRRIEVLTGPGRRRRWSAEEKARIVAETLEPGASVSEVARRWQVCPQQVFGRRPGSGPAAKSATTRSASSAGSRQSCSD